jgi:hypothetical protein
MLRERRITLLDPETWDDKNDAYFLKLYKQKLNHSSVLVLCFTRTTETYHHWKVFANGASGVCISFKRRELLYAVNKQKGLRIGNVKYLKLNQLGARNTKAKELPFLKRFPFAHENEFRMVVESPHVLKSPNISIPLTCIDKITLSPWLNHGLSIHVKRTLWEIPRLS